jgi:hypothetical protein
MGVGAFFIIALLLLIYTQKQKNAAAADVANGNDHAAVFQVNNPAYRQGGGEGADALGGAEYVDNPAVHNAARGVVDVTGHRAHATNHPTEQVTAAAAAAAGGTTQPTAQSSARVRVVQVYGAGGDATYKAAGGKGGGYAAAGGSASWAGYDDVTTSNYRTMSVSVRNPTDGTATTYAIPLEDSPYDAGGYGIMEGSVYSSGSSIYNGGTQPHRAGASTGSVLTSSNNTYDMQVPGMRSVPRTNAAASSGSNNQQNRAAASTGSVLTSSNNTYGMQVPGMRSNRAPPATAISSTSTQPHRAGASTGSVLTSSSNTYDMQVPGMHSNRAPSTTQTTTIYNGGTNTAVYEPASTSTQTAAAASADANGYSHIPTSEEAKLRRLASTSDYAVAAPHLKADNGNENATTEDETATYVGEAAPDPDVAYTGSPPHTRDRGSRSGSYVSALSSTTADGYEIAQISKTGGGAAARIGEEAAEREGEQRGAGSAGKPHSYVNIIEASGNGGDGEGGGRGGRERGNKEAVGAAGKPHGYVNTNQALASTADAEQGEGGGEQKGGGVCTPQAHRYVNVIDAPPSDAAAGDALPAATRKHTKREKMNALVAAAAAADDEATAAAAAATNAVARQSVVISSFMNAQPTISNDRHRASDEAAANAAAPTSSIDRHRAPSTYDGFGASEGDAGGGNIDRAGRQQSKYLGFGEEEEV